MTQLRIWTFIIKLLGPILLCLLWSLIWENALAVQAVSLSFWNLLSVMVHHGVKLWRLPTTLLHQAASINLECSTRSCEPELIIRFHVVHHWELTDCSGLYCLPDNTRLQPIVCCTSCLILQTWIASSKSKALVLGSGDHSNDRPAAIDHNYRAWTNVPDHTNVKQYQVSVHFVRRGSDCSMVYWRSDEHDGNAALLSMYTRLKIDSQ